MDESVVAWLSSEEGKNDYRQWLASLVEKTNTISKTKLLLTFNDEIGAIINLKEEFIPENVKNDPDYDSNNPPAFKVEFQVKDLILRELQKIAQNIEEMPEELRELITYEEVFENIEDAIVKDFVYKAEHAQEIFEERFNNGDNIDFTVIK